MLHPRKTEVKLINPFRVYSAVTHAIKQALHNSITVPDKQIITNTSSVSYRPSQPSQWDKKQDDAYSRLRGNQPQFFFDGVKEEQTETRPQYANSFETPEATQYTNDRIPEYIVSQAKMSLSDADISPILGRYIIVGYLDEVWIVDQHAAAERVRYEQFKNAYLNGDSLPKQHLLVTNDIPLTGVHCFDQTHERFK